jgi:hypothetical protein
MNTLDIVDRRSLQRLLQRGGVERLFADRTPPTISEFLRTQRFLADAEIIEAVSRRLRD